MTVVARGYKKKETLFTAILKYDAVFVFGADSLVVYLLKLSNSLLTKGSELGSSTFDRFPLPTR